MMDEGTYIVTGATGAIGRELVRELVGRNVQRVILACRDMAKANKMCDIDSVTELIPMKLDLCSTASVKAFAQNIIEGQYHIRALINNAGAMPSQLILTEESHEMATQVNYVSTKLLTDMLIPVMENGSVIVFTTSITRKIVKMRADWDVHAKQCHKPLRRFLTYGRSKLMITQYARQLARQLSDRNIRVNCADPGIVDSAMINMENRCVDTLSNLFFRPLIRTPRQGAIPAIRAMDATDTGCIFTLHAMHPISNKNVGLDQNS